MPDIAGWKRRQQGSIARRKTPIRGAADVFGAAVLAVDGAAEKEQKGGNSFLDFLAI
jgi:hypothetical protein